jgi:hypothetical protein
MKPILVVLTAACALAQTHDVATIMARVAENQSVAKERRKEWVFHQKQLLRMVRTNGKLAREERREYHVMPNEKGQQKELTRLDGKYEHKGKYISYDREDFSYKDVDLDGDLVNDMSKSMTGDADARDGIGADLFPLTAEQQRKYNFKLLGTETFRGRPVHRVAFEPRPRDKGQVDVDLGGHSLWKGEARIDAEEYQPVTISTSMAPKIPAAVKILLGTDIKGLGFSLAYQKFAEGIWFPVSYGGEFEVKAVFFYKRRISVSMVNDDFRRADVSSKVAYAAEEK